MLATFYVFMRFFRAIGRGMKEPEFRALFLTVILLLVVGASFYHFVEGWSWLAALYFTVITLTTVGYGDFSPSQDISKVFTMIYIVLGLGVFSAFIVLLADSLRGEANPNTSQDTGDA